MKGYTEIKVWDVNKFKLWDLLWAVPLMICLLPIVLYNNIKDGVIIMLKRKYHKTTIIIGKPIIGKQTWIGANTIIDGSGGLIIGDRCDISCGVQIYTHSTALRCISNKKYNPDDTVNREEIIRKPVNIGDNTFIGANSIIQMGINIGSNCIIGAGAIVTKNIPSKTIVFGNPARRVGKVIINQDKVGLRYNL